jgi:penicillin V acylase-like amidase (Ntn superfamily)
MEENTMFNLKKSFSVLPTKVLAASLALAPVNAGACTRVVYLGPNDDVITARSMDWNADIGTNLWIFPKGMERSGEAGRNSLRWTSKYGSVIASGFDVSTTADLTFGGWFMATI